MLVALPFELGQRQGGELRCSNRVDARADVAQLPRQILDQLSEGGPFVGRRRTALRLQLRESGARGAIGLRVTHRGVPGLGGALHVAVRDTGRRVDGGELARILLGFGLLGGRPLARRPELVQLRIQLLDPGAHLLGGAGRLAARDEIAASP